MSGNHLKHIWHSNHTEKKMRRNILLIKIKDYMVLIHVLRKSQVKIFLNSANVHFQNKGKDLSYLRICYLKSEKKYQR